MDLRPGYKRTEAGVIPEEWVVKPLGELASLRNGFAFRSATYTALGNLKVITIANVQDGYMSTRDCNSIAIEPRDLQAHQRLRRGDILISMTGNVGRVCRVTEEGCLLNQRVGKLVPIAVESDFLFALLRQPSFLKSMTGVAKGGAQPNLSVSEISDHPFCLPTNGEEQRAIAAALNDVELLLAGLDRLIAKKRDLKQAAMQQLLTGQTRLPGFQGEWKMMLLSEIIDQINDGATPSTADPGNFGGSISWVVIDDIKDEIGSTKGTITHRGLSSCAAMLWMPGTLIVSTGATIGEVGVLAVPAATKQGICGIVFAESLAKTAFMRFWFIKNKALLIAKAQGSTIKEVRPPTLMKLEIALPSLAEQDAIAAILTDMDAELTALEARRDKTRALKQGMMQELLTGRTRLV